VLVAAGVDRIPRAWLRAFAVVVLVTLSVRGTIAYYERDFDLDRDDYRAASKYLLDRARPGDVVLFDIAQARMPYEFYRSIHDASGNAPRVIYPSAGDHLDYHDFLGKPAVDFLHTVPGQYDRVWVVLKFNGTQTGPDPTTQKLSEIFAKEYPTIEERVFPGVIVRLYSKASGTH
jgi:hypothetical protein